MPSFVRRQWRRFELYRIVLSAQDRGASARVSMARIAAQATSAPVRARIHGGRGRFCRRATARVFFVFSVLWLQHEQQKSWARRTGDRRASQNSAAALKRRRDLAPAHFQNLLVPKCGLAACDRDGPSQIQRWVGRAKEGDMPSLSSLWDGRHDPCFCFSPHHYL